VPNRTSRSVKQRTLLALAGVTVAVLATGAPAASSATGSSPGSAAAERGASYVETRLFFGTERPDGGAAVTDRQFMDFIDRNVTPSFPDGLTVQDGRGQWRDSHGSIERERSYELILLYPAAQASSRDAQIQRIRQDYVALHAQDSVARLDEATSADF
jgi:hypothetical protein